ncbi:MAG TPA: DegT/DnrJ/EryC1/StrS family aminotransferase [Allosphingosinicella sp.]|nr:DegT/DnrJ/EryC1/StrS family aminotransferase [Allosphingosinicella sp.]
MVQFIDLKTQYEGIQEEVEAAVLKVLRGGNYIMGPEVAELEEALSRYVGVAHTVSCASGTDALVMALMAKGVGPGDAVFAPPFTFVATAEAAATLGAVPVFVDVDPVTFNIDPAAFERAVRAVEEADPSLHPLPRLGSDELAKLTPKGLIAVDLFGLPADYEALNAVAAPRGMFVIEDAAQSFGGRAGNRRAGSLAEIGCTSFFPAKPLGCYGDGGAIFSDDAEFADLLRSIRVHGQGSHKYENVRLGLTGRLDTVQAAVLLTKLRVFDAEMDARQRVAGLYERIIGESALPVETPRIPRGYLSAWAQYSVLARDGAERERLVARLGQAGIPTAIYYPRPLHLQPVFAPLGYREGDFPVSEALAGRIFSLPMHPYLDETTIRAIVAAMASEGGNAR